MDATFPEWVKPGAPVVVTPHNGVARELEIARVTKTQVVLSNDTGPSGRFRASDFRTNDGWAARSTGMWGLEYLYPADHPRAVAAVAEQRKRSRVNKVRSAYERWLRDTSDPESVYALLVSVKALSSEEDQS